MKQPIFFLLLLLIIIAFGCKKIGLEDITQTDRQGNIIAIGNPDEWQAGQDSSIIEEHFTRFYGNAGLDTIVNFCKNVDNPITEIVAFPNPMPSDAVHSFKITANEPLQFVSFVLAGGSIGYGPEEEGGSTIVARFTNDWPRTDGHIYYLIQTKAGCTYTGYGYMLHE